MVKKGIRVLGLDDGNLDERVLVVGVIYKITGRVDGIISFFVKKDGKDSTEKIIENVRKSRFFKTINVIMTSGISFGGFNVFDIERIWEETGKPVIVVISRKPNFEKIRKALEKFEDFEERWEMIMKAGKVNSVRVGNSRIYYQFCGISEREVKEIILSCCKDAKIPEPIRLAHMIASGITLGESSRKI